MPARTKLLATALSLAACTGALAQSVYECKPEGEASVPVFTDAPVGLQARHCTLIGTAAQRQPARTRAPKYLVPLIAAAAERHQLPYELLEALVAAESAFVAEAVSSKGAMGLTQLMPATARELGVQRVFDPAENLDGGARHLGRLLQTWHGNVPLALAAYNAGEAAVSRYGNRVPPYPETIEYVRRIQARLGENPPVSVGRLAGTQKPAPSGPGRR